MDKKEYRQALLHAASEALDEGIEKLEALDNSYDPSEGPFSGAHPKAGNASVLRTLKTINKSLKRGRV